MRAAAGYTLLEMTVVLAIIGLVMSVAGPPLFKTVERYRERVALDELRMQMQHLPVLVAREGRAAVLDDEHPWPGGKAWPDAGGWQVHYLQPLVVRANGYCEGARVEFVHGQRRIPAEIAAPFCALRAGASP